MSTVTVSAPREVLPAGVRPAAVQHANYAGDATDMAVLGQLVGPNTLGEVLVAVEATYDEATDRTRVGFAYVPQEGLADVAARFGLSNVLGGERE